MSIDLGTGDGRAVLHAARADPGGLVIGVDADASSMRRASRRAADRATGVPNATFVVSAVERLPADLAGVADRVTISFPWGSLLRGVVIGEGCIVANVARVCAPEAEVLAMWSLTPRDGSILGPGSDDQLRLERAWRRAGLEIVEIRPASPADVALTCSSWAKRLQVGSRRGATLLRAFRR